MARIVCLGEAMVELSGTEGAWNMGFGGDTLNTAIHLARAGHDVAYMTALGEDAFSTGLRRAWEAEGIDTGLVLTHPTRQAGLYAITTDASGERSFSYWRETSAARALFDLEAAEAAMDVAQMANLLCFSLISLAILPPSGRDALLRLAGRVRDRGGLVAFDGNYRPRLWESPEAATRMRDKAIALADIGLPTFEDEAMLDNAKSPQDVALHWRRLGCGEIVVKLGERGCVLSDGTTCPVPITLNAVDTSGAGDAFNGGYLSARLAGEFPADAAQQGHRVAGWTLMRRGAVPPRDAADPYR